MKEFKNKFFETFYGIGMPMRKNVTRVESATFVVMSQTDKR